MSDTIIKSVEDFVRQEMQWVCTAHDFMHIQRVVSNAQKIQEMEWKWDRDVITISALLHESLDEKFFSAEGMNQRKIDLCSFLESLSISWKSIERILFIIENIGFWKSLDRPDDFPSNIDFQIVEDADRLEAIWAINIARTFSYWGKRRDPIYDPDIQPVLITNKKHYYKNADTSTSFNHFYEKLLLLKDMMHTDSGKHLAEPRHEFMEEFMRVFLAEWRGER